MFLHENDMVKEKESNDMDQKLYPHYPNGVLDNTLNVRIDSLEKLMGQKSKEVDRWFGSIETQINNTVTSSKELERKLSELETKVEVMNSKVEDLEKWKWWGIGGIFLIVVIYFLKLAINVYKS